VHPALEENEVLQEYVASVGMPSAQNATEQLNAQLVPIRSTRTRENQTVPIRPPIVEQGAHVIPHPWLFEAIDHL